MKVLVANLGSTSFKYQLLDMQSETPLARGRVERIGESSSPCEIRIGEHVVESEAVVPDHAEAVRQCLAQLTDPDTGCLRATSDVSAIAFKAVHGGRVGGVQRVTDDVLDAMEEMSTVAPAHNPPYIAAMRLLHDKLPEIPLVAAFETDFHRNMPERNRYYAVPLEWAEQYGVRRWGFHGASHRYIATRTAELLERDDPRIISCHLGGSSSLCAIRGGVSQKVSMGMSPQGGVPQNNRVGDFDCFALPIVMERTGKSLAEVLDVLAEKSGLAALSGVGGDLRDISEAAEGGNPKARLALDVYAADVRHSLGACLVELGGADVIVFTGGIGENRPAFRAMVLAGLEEFGIVLDDEANASASDEAPIHAESSRAKVWVIPTNEELIVARQARDLLGGTS